jgi:transketolase
MMRGAFVDTLVEAAVRDERLFLLTADLGWSVLERFASRHPDRFLNVGVAEANMAGVATGLALAGYVPYIYSIASFASMRCYEQVRDGAVLHGLPLRVVGIGGGYSYGHAGPTHFALEDLAILRAQPAMTVLAPADPAQARTIVHALADRPGPAYIRVGKGHNPEVPGLDGRFAFGRPELVREGGELLILACGSIVHEGLRAAERLEKERGRQAAVAALAHLTFAPTPALVELLARFAFVLTLEEGYTSGGLGALVAEAIAVSGLRCRLKACGVTRPFAPLSGSEAYMRAAAGIDAAAVATAAEALVAGR